MASLLPSKAALAAATASNALFKPTTRPVALFLGGTSGIGQAMAEQLARQTNGRAHIILLGRNQEAAERIIAGFPKTSATTPAEESSNYSFIKIDATSMAQVRQVTSKLSKELNKINFIITTAGISTIKGTREETDEGIDKKMACNFYARFRLIYDLLPLVEKAKESGETTGVVSVLAPGRGGPIDESDLGPVRTYGLSSSRNHGVAYTDTTFEKFSQLHPRLGFYHIFPGAVATPMNIGGSTAGQMILPFVRWLFVLPTESAQMMWWRVWGSEPGWQTGSHQISQRGEEILPNKYVSEEGKKAIWEHALKMTS